MSHFSPSHSAKSQTEEKSRAEWDSKRRAALDRKQYLERSHHTKLDALAKLKRELSDAQSRAQTTQTEWQALQQQTAAIQAEAQLKLGVGTKCILGGRFFEAKANVL
jgi:hypothetical protein